MGGYAHFLLGLLRHCGRQAPDERSRIMRISYDSEVDALYIRLLEGEYQCRTLRLTSGE